MPSMEKLQSGGTCNTGHLAGKPTNAKVGAIMSYHNLSGTGHLDDEIPHTAMALAFIASKSLQSRTHILILLEDLLVVICEAQWN